MRRFAFCFLIFTAALTAGAADFEFLHLWSQWRDTDSFRRIGEYFGGPENTGREIVLRTHPDSRDGYYFLVRVKHAAPLAGAKFALRVIRPDAPTTRTFAFSVPASPAGAHETVFELGLTGADWPGGKSAQPVAWKLELLSSDDRVLVTEKSFLWENPPK